VIAKTFTAFNVTSATRYLRRYSIIEVLLRIGTVSENRFPKRSAWISWTSFANARGLLGRRFGG
jgi:hypothetical protein